MLEFSLKSVAAFLKTIGYGGGGIKIALFNATSSALVSDFTDQFALNALDLNMKFKFKWS